MITDLVDRTINSVYGCGAGMLRAIGLNALSRKILDARTTARVRANLDTLETAMTETRHMMKRLTDDMNEEQAELDAALLAVRRMSKRRIEERKLRAERMGVPFSFKKSDLLIWMNDVSELNKIEDLRIHKMRYRNLEKRVHKMHAGLLHLQQQQAALEDVLGNADLIRDLGHITDLLKKSNAVDLNSLVTDLATKAYRIADDMHDVRDTVEELNREMRDVVDALPDRKPMSREEAMDIVDLILESTEVPRIVPRGPDELERRGEKKKEEASLVMA